MTDFRDARIDSQKAALLLDMSVNELREAVMGNALLREGELRLMSRHTRQSPLATPGISLLVQ